MNKCITKKFLILNLLICFMALLLVSCKSNSVNLINDKKASVSEEVKGYSTKEEILKSSADNNVDEKICEDMEVNEECDKKFKLYLKEKGNDPIEIEIRNITANAKNVLFDVINCLNFDDSTIITEGGRSFAISNIYKSREEVYNALHDYYTDEAICSFLDNYTLEEDNKFYIIYGQGGVGLSVSDDDLYIEQTETNLRAVYTKTIDDNWTITQEYNFIKYNNYWIRSDITLYP